jgi:hypothetical protein
MGHQALRETLDRLWRIKGAFEFESGDEILTLWTSSAPYSRYWWAGIAVRRMDIVIYRGRI